MRIIMNYEYCDGMTHTIRQGETLYSLSRQYNVPLAIILRANPYIDVYNLQIGSTICIPVKNQDQPGISNCTGCGAMGGAVPGGNCKDKDNGKDNYNDDYDKDDYDYDKDDKDDDDKDDYDYDQDDKDDDNNDDYDYDQDDNDDKDDKGYGIGKGSMYNSGTGMKIDMDIQRNMGLKRSTDSGYMPAGGMEKNIINSMESGAQGGFYTMGGITAPVRNNKKGIWVKYVAQAGDTLQDILDKSEGTTDMFWEKNQAGRMYMLPGVAYFILENSTD